MTKNKKNDFNTFVQNAEEIRKRPLSKEDIDRINEISKRVEIEENESNQEFDIPVAAKERNESSSAQL